MRRSIAGIIFAIISGISAFAIPEYLETIGVINQQSLAYTILGVLALLLCTLVWYYLPTIKKQYIIKHGVKKMLINIGIGIGTLGVICLFASGFILLPRIASQSSNLPLSELNDSEMKARIESWLTSPPSSLDVQESEVIPKEVYWQYDVREFVGGKGLSIIRGKETPKIIFMKTSLQFKPEPEQALLFEEKKTEILNKVSAELATLDIEFWYEEDNTKLIMQKIIRIDSSLTESRFMEYLSLVFRGIEIAKIIILQIVPEISNLFSSEFLIL